jgi:hypothetical protein
MVFNLTHSQIILRYKENGGRIEPYTIVIMLSSTLCHVLSIYVASEMTNSNLFQKSQNFLKSQNWPNKQNWPKKTKLAKKPNFG